MGGCAAKMKANGVAGNLSKMKDATDAAGNVATVAEFGAGLAEGDLNVEDIQGGIDAVKSTIEVAEYVNDQVNSDKTDDEKNKEEENKNTDANTAQNNQQTTIKAIE